jgi:uncharacterized protein (DUF1800 family)
MSIRRIVLPLALLLYSGLTSAQLIGEITGVEFSDATTIAWDSSATYPLYNIYRGELSGLAANDPARCRAYDLPTESHLLKQLPGPGSGFYYLVTGQRPSGEGTPGVSTSSDPRLLLGSCRPLMQNHVMDRLGYGWGEWSKQRIDTLGIDAYIAEQLNPSTIDEATNAELNDALMFIDPPQDIFHLIQQQMVRAVYARRQLEQQVATFWFNHFNTDWNKLAMIFQGVFPQCQAPGTPPQCDPGYPSMAYAAAAELQYDDVENFRAIGMGGGNFREMLEDASLSLAMIVYLDTYLSVAGSPNENFPRELMELHAMGVDCGYDQSDIEELSRVITGWTGCKKELADVDDPLAPCISQYWLDTPPGKWVATFVPGNHDCSSKTLFGGTPYEVVIPFSCGSPPAQIAELETALDAIAAHPCTAEFISTKLLQRFVSDTPTPAQVDELVAVWNDGGNPHGVGDLGAVLTALVVSDGFRDPDDAGSKIKTPLEYLAGVLRASRGSTDGQERVINYLVSMNHIPHFNPVPTGWPEDGDSWLDTNNTLDRQNFAFELFLSANPNFSADPLGLLNDNGVSTATGNAEGIIDFFAEVLFGTALTPAERQAAIDYLETNTLGVPSPYNNSRILETLGAMMGYPHFQEQ